MWQTLETKARFIQQVMNGQTSVRSAEDLDGGALTYAEIKAIASGNPAVMEKVKVDTEIRKLDQLRAAHLNQQHSIRLQIRALPSEIKERQERIARLCSRHRNPRRPRRRRVLDDRRQAGLFRQGRARGRRDGAHLRHPVVARRPDPAGARAHSAASRS